MDVDVDKDLIGLKVSDNHIYCPFAKDVKLDKYTVPTRN